MAKPSGLQPPRRGLLLGRLGGVSGKRKLSRPRLPTALWGIQKGKADAPSGEPGDIHCRGEPHGRAGRLTAFPPPSN